MNELYRFPDLGARSIETRLKRVERTVQFPKRGIIADSGSGFRTVAADQVDREGRILINGVATIAPPPTFVQELMAPDSSNATGWSKVNALVVGGYDDKVGLLKVRDAKGNTVGYVGGLAGGTYGAWFKTVGVGGADQDNPNLWVDEYGNIHMYGGTILGLSGLAVDSDGNVHLKNILQINGTTANPSITGSFADLPELGSGNSAMTVTTHGNPCLIGVNLSFMSQSAGGGYVDSISVGIGGDYAAGVVPDVIIAGDGGGALATANMVATGGGHYTIDTITVDDGGSGYTFASASFSPPGGVGGSAASATVNVIAPTVNDGVPIGIQVLQDGLPIIGPLTITTDASGRCSTTVTTIVSPSAASHSYQVQAKRNSGVLPVQSTSRAFQVLELG